MTVKLYYDSEWLISSEAYEIYKDCMYRPVYEKYLRETRNFADDDDIYVFVCVDNSQNVGMLVMRMKDGGEGEIVGIAVKPEYRRKGAGAYLIKESAKMMNIKKLTAQTDGDTVLFYKALGFECKAQKVKYPDGVCERFNCEKTVNK